MKKTRSIYQLALASLLAVSCNKLIDIPDHPPTQISQTAVFSDSADIYSAVAGVYVSFKANTANAGLGSTNVMLTTGLLADELGTNYAAAVPIFSDAMLVSDGNASGMWSSGYSSLYAVNVCITGISGTTALSDSTKHQLIAELKAVRAFFYFQMVNLWGGVPLITSADYNVSMKQGRATADEVYQLIQADLAEARATLQPTYPSTTGRYRINLYAAQALSAKVFLYRQQWDSATMMTNSIISSGTYSLVTDPTEIYLQGSNEAIWALPGNGTNYQTGEAYTLLPFSTFSAPNYYVNTPLLNAFEPGDLRLAAWTKSETVGGKTYTLAAKYKNQNLYSATTQEDYMMFRLGDMYLVAAEAAAEKGDSTTAITDLDMVRTRAGLLGYTGTNLLAAIQHERQVEMCYEWGNRFFDLKRTGTIDAVLSLVKTGWDHNDAFLPIPGTEIQNNPVLTQNDGY